MALQPAGLNAGADGVAGVAMFASLHSANPDPSGANEVTGNGYARLPITWDAATGRIAGLSATLRFAGASELGGDPHRVPLGSVGWHLLRVGRDQR